MEKGNKNRKELTFTINREAKEIIVSCVFDAPKDLVWKMYTDPKLIPLWWGPKRLATKVEKMDVRPGGTWRFIQFDKDGRSYAFHGTYREVVPLECMIYTFSFEGIPPEHELFQTVKFEEYKKPFRKNDVIPLRSSETARTKVTETTVYKTIEDLEKMLNLGMKEGVIESMDRFGELLTSKELVIGRTFSAPRDLIWKMFTDPKLIPLWWGPKEFKVPYAEIDFRTGGKYLISMQSPDGKEFWSTGIYLDIIPPERLVMMDSFADEHGHEVPSTYYGLERGFPMEMLIKVELREDINNTKLTLKHSDISCISSKDLGNMKQGWNQSFDKLEEVLKNLK